jgi:hypothetical protein
MARRMLGRRQRLARVGGLHRRGWEGGVPGTTWLGMTMGDVGISGDSGYSTIGSSTNGAGLSSNPKCGGGDGARSMMTNSSSGAVGH